MTGPHAQLISLVTHGNHFLQSGSLVADYYPVNSTFQFCNSVQLSTQRSFLGGLWKMKPTHADVPGWFAYLQKHQCKQLYLNYTPMQVESWAEEYMTAGLTGGAGRWMIQALFDQGAQFWEGRWEVTNQDAADRRIWSVKYNSDGQFYSTPPMRLELAEIRQQLQEALQDIGDFAHQHFEDYGHVFDKALEALHSDAPVQFYYHKDLIVEADYSLERKQLLFSAASAWVFGGMGSWNDTGFEDPAVQKRYTAVTRNLYRTVNRSVIAAINQ